jgi:hypothetical protein
MNSQDTDIQDEAVPTTMNGVLTAEQALALYYSGRLAYDARDGRHPIGRYNSVGEIVRYTIGK